MKRKIISINEEKCNGCGLCIPACHEGALQVIDGKVRLISDLFCDGLGACIGHCPEDAITIEEREAEPYNETKVMEILVTKGRNTILAHLGHLRDHNEQEFLAQAIAYIREHDIDLQENTSAFHVTEKPAIPIMETGAMAPRGCPGSVARDFRIDLDKVNANSAEKVHAAAASARSELMQWPVQLHLLNPMASYFKEADVLLTADCVAFAMGDFHSRFLQGKALAIACPKLDSNKESYIEKLTVMIRDAEIKSLSVIIMEVPCCGGLLQMARMAMKAAGRDIPINEIVISVKGEVLREEVI
jgi:NAD-dependent dihydropyrimidine dehydrogenase PreA subunit